MKTLPDYVETRGHGEECYPGPLQLTDVTGYGFPLSVDRERLQAFVDTQLNRPCGGAYHFTALPFVIHTCVSVGRATTSSQQIGWLPDQESMFFVPLLQKRHGDLLPTPTFWVPYLFIDAMSGMVTGRELWGYRKMPASIRVPRPVEQATHFWCDTMMFRTFSTETRGQYGRLLETTGDTVVDDWRSIWNDPADALREVFGRVTGELGADALKLTEDILAPLFGQPEFPIVCLKQYRDAAENTKACYQGLIHAPNRLDDWTGGGILPGNFELRITTCDSHQIVSDLGLATLDPQADSTVLKPLFGFWITMNFSALPGRILWEAGA